MATLSALSPRGVETTAHIFDQNQPRAHHNDGDADLEDTQDIDAGPFRSWTNPRRQRNRRMSTASMDSFSGDSNSFGCREMCWIFSFSLYLLVSTILSLFLRGGRTVTRTVLAMYTLLRLMIGFQLLLLFRILRWCSEYCSGCAMRLFVTRSEMTLLERLDNASCYSEYADICKSLDDLSTDIQNWKCQDDSEDFDYQLLKRQYTALKHAKLSSDVNTIMQSMSNVFRRAFAGLQNPNLYSHSYIGTKYLIEDYLAEVMRAIQFVATHDDDQVTIQDRIDYFIRCKKSLGRTALCLSGGGALAMAHLGVVRVLARENCLPKVISGTSGGAIVAGYLATLTDEEIKVDVDDWQDLANRFGVRFLPTFASQLLGAFRNKVLMDSQDFTDSMRKYVRDLTFLEAWERTKRHVSISVSYSTKNVENKSHAHSLILNHITAPHVLIASAITASCALPGLMIPQQLYSKDRNGRISPYYPDGIHWVDGSMEADIPYQQLQEQFRVNYFLVSQVNPHITPFLDRSFATSNNTLHSHSHHTKWNILRTLDDICNNTVNHQLDRLAALKTIPPVYGQSFDKFANQGFTGHITIIPNIPLSLRLKILSHPTNDDMMHYLRVGESATWGYVSHISNMLCLEKELDRWLEYLQKQRRRSMSRGLGLDMATRSMQDLYSIQRADSEFPPPLEHRTPPLSLEDDGSIVSGEE